MDRTATSAIADTKLNYYTQRHSHKLHDTAHVDRAVMCAITADAIGIRPPSLSPSAETRTREIPVRLRPPTLYRIAEGRGADWKNQDMEGRHTVPVSGEL